MSEVKRVTPEKQPLAPAEQLDGKVVFQAYDVNGDVAQLELELIDLIEGEDYRALQAYQTNTLLLATLQASTQHAAAIYAKLNEVHEVLREIAAMQKDAISTTHETPSSDMISSAMKALLDNPELQQLMNRGMPGGQVT